MLMLRPSDPEEARIPVPDSRFDWLCEVYKPASKVPAFLTCIDIAGLTAGASTGAFLSHVRAVDGIFQCVRAFDDAEVIHVEGDVDPLRDMQIISTELRLKDIEWVEKELEKHKKNARSLGNVSLADKAKKEEAATVEKIYKILTEENKDVRKGTWTNKEVSAVPCTSDTSPVPSMLDEKVPSTIKPSSSRPKIGPMRYCIVSDSQTLHTIHASIHFAGAHALTTRLRSR
jgi:ribosome-binding ATPase YchF (GTP1/OBG family)